MRTSMKCHDGSQKIKARASHSSSILSDDRAADECHHTDGKQRHERCHPCNSTWRLLIQHCAKHNRRQNYLHCTNTLPLNDQFPVEPLKFEFPPVSGRNKRAVCVKIPVAFGNQALLLRRHIWTYIIRYLASFSRPGSYDSAFRRCPRFKQPSHFLQARLN